MCQAPAQALAPVLAPPALLSVPPAAPVPAPAKDPQSHRYWHHRHYFHVSVPPRQQHQYRHRPKTHSQGGVFLCDRVLSEQLTRHTSTAQRQVQVCRARHTKPAQGARPSVFIVIFLCVCHDVSCGEAVACPWRSGGEWPLVHSDSPHWSLRVLARRVL